MSASDLATRTSAVARRARGPKGPPGWLVAFLPTRAPKRQAPSVIWSHARRPLVVAERARAFELRLLKRFECLLGLVVRAVAPARLLRCRLLHRLVVSGFGDGL